MNTHIAESELIARWTRAGAAFNSAPSTESPDLERLLLDTARFASKNARLFSMAYTWLCKYSDLIARHRLKRLIQSELEAEYKPILGLLLDMARAKAGIDHFNVAIGACDRASEPRPLFDVERGNSKLRKLAERRASAISRKWNLWTADIEVKPDALRPPKWLMKHNPDYVERGYLKGDLRCSIVQELLHNPGAGESESALARCCSANRPAVRDALDALELVGRVERVPHMNKQQIRLKPRSSIAA